MIIFSFTFAPLIIAEIARKEALPTVEDFFLYSRRMPLLLSFFTIYATWYSSFAVLGSGATFYQHGPLYMTAFAWNVLFAIGLYSLGRRIWYYGRKNNYITISDFFRDIYGSQTLSNITTGIALIFTIPYLEVQLYGGTYLINVATRGAIPWRIALLLFFSVMIVYLWAGGIRSVSMTDIFYGISIFCTMVFMGLLLAHKAGGVREIFDALAARDPSFLTLTGKEDENMILWLTMFIIVPTGALMSPPIWLRCYSMKKAKDFSTLSVLIALCTMGYIGSVLAGSAAKILMPNFEQPDMVIPYLIIKEGHLILAALLFCGMSAASLSTANSQIHSLSAIYTIDVHKRYIEPEATDARLIKITKIVLLIVSAATYVLLVSTRSMLVHTGLIALAGAAQLIVPTAGALFWTRSTAHGAMAGLLAGETILIALALFTNLDGSLAGCIGLTVNAALFILCSLCSKPSAEAKNRIAAMKCRFEEDRAHLNL